MKPDKKPVYCMHCKNWGLYLLNREDQCETGLQEISSEIINQVGFKHMITRKIYGHPSELNKNNDCSYYKERGSFGKLFLRVFCGIPLKPTIEQKVE